MEPKRIEAWETEMEIVVIYGDEEIPETHDCDYMGCSSVAHVRFRFYKFENRRSDVEYELKIKSS